MVDTKLIESLIESRGVKKSFLANQMGISIQTLRRKLTGQVDVTSREIECLCRELGVTSLGDKEKIFFKK